MNENYKIYASQAYLHEQIDTKVDKVDGYGLSTNDFTNEEKTVVSNALVKTEQTLTSEEIEQVRQNIHSAGIMTSGLTMTPFNVIEVNDYDDWEVEYLDPVVAQQGAEIYGDYVYNVATGMWSRASGAGTQALGDFSDASGWLTKATAFCAISSGRQTEASGPYSHAEGHRTSATSNDSHAEGEGSTATGARAHAEGYFTQALNNQAHSEGMNTIAKGINSHAEGWACEANGQNAFAGGKYTKANATNSTARGLYTIAAGSEQFVNGKYNISDTTSAFIIGNGTAEDSRKNAALITKTGDAWFSGNVYIGSAGGLTKDEGSKKLATEEYVNTSVANLVNSAPETLDTLGELATAFQENEEVVEVLNQAITTKYDNDNPPPYPVTSVEGQTGNVVLNFETWTFTLADGSTVTKNVVVK